MKIELFCSVYQTSATCSMLNLFILPAFISIYFQFFSVRRHSVSLSPPLSLLSASIILHFNFFYLFISHFFVDEPPPIIRTIRNETSRNRRHDFFVSFPFLFLTIILSFIFWNPKNYSVFDLNQGDALHDYRINSENFCVREKKKVICEKNRIIIFNVPECRNYLVVTNQCTIDLLHYMRFWVAVMFVLSFLVDANADRWQK